ncbi:MAG: hypothetical protein LBV43_04490 [Prevotella sp.]|jgi:hypothetical protein|nr:hypothetical protein [Prevotella sp.]
MGFRTYLILRIEDEDTELFESNNAMPLFWIGLLDRNIISDSKPSWIHYDELVESKDELNLERFTDIRPNPMWFYVNRVQFEVNTERMSKYLENKYAELFPLFSDFTNYIRSKFDHEDNEIMIDMAMMANMDGAMPLLDDIYDEIARINKGENLSDKFFLPSDLITTATGYGYTDFKVFSSIYNELEEKTLYTKRIQRERSYPKGQFRWQSFVWFSFILLLCPFFSVLMFLMIKQQGISFYGIVGILSNIGFYWYSIYQVRKQILLFKKK